MKKLIDDIANISFEIGGHILIWIFLVYSLAILNLILNNQLTGSCVGWATLIDGLLIFLSNKNNLVQKGVVLLGVAISIGLSYWAARVFLDLSFDGQSYHREAINQLMTGWNPLYQKIVPDVWDHTFAIWLNHFPFFSWLTSAEISLFFGGSEYGKLINGLLPLSTFLIAIRVLSVLKTSSFSERLAVAGILFINPVFITQFWSYYLDVQVAAMVFNIILLSWLYYQNKSKLSLVLLAICIIMAINIKLTVVAYVPVLVGGVWLAAGWIKKKLNWQYAFFCGLFFLVGFAVYGFHPYVNNYIDYGSPFYPMYTVYPIKQSENKEKYFHLVPALPYVENVREYIYESNMPKNFGEMNRIQKLFNSLFSKSSNLVPYTKSGQEHLNQFSILKMPGWVFKEELSPFMTTDVRIGGFGPWYSLVLVISFAVLIYMSFIDKNMAILGWLAMVIIVLSSTLNSELWWARYVPQMWLIGPIVWVLIKSIGKNWWFNLAGWWLLGIMVIQNGGLFLYSVKKQWAASQARMQYLQTLARASEINPVVVDFGSLRGMRSLYKEYGIKYSESAIEVGVLENHLLNKLKPDEVKVVLNSYDKISSEYLYRLKKNSDKKLIRRLSEIMEPNDMKLERVAN